MWRRGFPGGWKGPPREIREMGRKPREAFTRSLKWDRSREVIIECGRGFASTEFILLWRREGLSWATVLQADGG